MKSRGRHVYRRNIEHNTDNRDKRTIEFIRDYQLYTTSVQRPKYDWTRDVGCQCGVRSNMIGYASPKPPAVMYYGGVPKQVYAYTRARSFTNVGVGSVAVQQKKRVRKIYLPEMEHRGVGSSDLSSLMSDRKPNYERVNTYYFQKKTSSKCVGGGAENTKQCTEKLSPIICHNYSKGTSPFEIHEEKAISKDIGNNTLDKNVANTTTQVENTGIQNDQVSSKQMAKGSKSVKHTEPIANIKSVRSPVKKFQCNSTVQKSSDSLEQHVHNLEDPSYIQSTGSSDPMENKLEKEYRKIFLSKNKEEKVSIEKPVDELKSTSLLRRRFEALKRGIVKKEDSKKNTNSTSKESSQAGQSGGAPVQRDISVESDPPSLEARSFSRTKMFSPPPSVHKHERRSRHKTTPKKSHTDKKEKDGLNWPPKDKADDKDVKGMFKMWEEKFNFEEGSKPESPGVSFAPKTISFEQKAKSPQTKSESEDKKEGKRFFFFKKKSKDKPKSPCNKKGVTTGRCEVKPCTILNRHNESPTKYSQVEKPKKSPAKNEESDDLLKKNWLKNFIQRTIESRKSLQIRWNNKTYTTSSSTVFELMDNMYRQTAVVIRSRSQTSTGTSSYYQSYHKHRVNFVQDIEAWMIPKLIPHRNTPYTFYHRTDGHRTSDRKWFIDKSKAFAHEIELVLNSKNFVKGHRTISSDYLRIDIPKGFFTDQSSSDKFTTSNSEEVYKIIEYESPESRSELRFKIKNNIGDFSHNDVGVTNKVSVRDKNIDTRVIETMIKKPPVHRDVVIQGSNVHIPKRCDVIGVGIITHRVNRDIGRSTLNLDDEVSEEESEQLLENSIKQCQFAQSYLRDYYRNWMPLGIDLFPSRASDFHIKCESDETLSSLHNQGDGTKSCPNISNDYHSNINPSSNSHASLNDLRVDKTKIFNTFKSTTKSETPLDTKRVLPKDSCEVLKKRMLYACGNRSRWNYSEDEPYSVPSIEDKAEQDAMQELGKGERPKKRCRKHVSITKCDAMAEGRCIPPDYQCDKSDKPKKCDKPKKKSNKSESPPPEPEFKPPGILSHSGKSSYTKHTIVREDNNCEILPPACREYCSTAKSPKCSKPSSAKSSSTSASSKKSSKNKSPRNTQSPATNGSPAKISLSKYNCPCSPCTPRFSRSQSPPMSPPMANSISTRKRAPVSPRKSTPITPMSQMSSIDSQQMSPDKLPSEPSMACPCLPKQKRKKMPKPPKPCTCISKESIRNKNVRRSPNLPLSQNSSSSAKRSNNSTSPQSKCSFCQEQSNKTRQAIDKSRTFPQSKTPPSQAATPPRQAGTPPPQVGTSPLHAGIPPLHAGTPPLHAGTSPLHPSRPCPCVGCLNKSRSQSPPGSQVLPPPTEPVSLQNSSKSLLNNPNLQQPCPGSPCQNALADLTKKIQSLPRIQGLHLKMKPAPFVPKCVSDCPASASENKKKDKGKVCKDDCLGSPSDEKIIIRVKKETPSTEEIRECQNVKVQDADGKTLYERRDYKAEQGVITHKSSVLGEMYKVNRMSTVSLEKLTLNDEKCAKSIANMIEISFGLKVTQGDKIAEINLSGGNDETDSNETKCNEGKSQDVFVINTETDPAMDDPNDKNDINIRIVIKNFESKTAKTNYKHNDEFSKKISQKFHTVSTGYSDVLGNNIDNMYSLHRTTIDLTSSKTQNSDSNEEDEKEENNQIMTENTQIKEISISEKEATENSQLDKDKHSGTILPAIETKETESQNNQSNEPSKKSSISNTQRILDKSDTYEILNGNRSENFEKLENNPVILTPLNIANEELTEPCPALARSTTSDTLLQIDKLIEKPESSDKLISNDEKLEIETVENKMDMNKKSGDTENKVTFESDSKIKSNKNSVWIKRSEIGPLKIVSTNEKLDSKMIDNKFEDEKLHNTVSCDIKKMETVVSEKSKTAINSVSNKDGISLEINETIDTYETTKLEISELIKKSSTNKNVLEFKLVKKVSESKQVSESHGKIQTDLNELILKTSTDNDIVENKLKQIEMSNKNTADNDNEKMQELKTADITQKINTDRKPMQMIENFKCMNTDDKINKPDITELDKSEISKFDNETKQLDDYLNFHKKFKAPYEAINNQTPEPVLDIEPPSIISKRNTDVESENDHTDFNKSETQFSHTDTDDQDIAKELTNTSDDAYDSTMMSKPHTKKEKKEMLKHVFEKATTQKWKTKGRMKRLKNMLKFILTSDSSEVDEVAVTSKELVKDITYSAFSPPTFMKDTDSMTNYYRFDGVLQSDDENKIPECYPTQDISECSDTSDYQTNVSKCLCHAMAERLNKHGELTTGCCCRSEKVHEQTSCNINNDLCTVNYKAAEYIDVQTQNSLINSKITNVMMVKKMESVMTSMKFNDIERLKQIAVSAHKDDKECEVKNVKTNTVVGVLDDGKIVIRTSDLKKPALKTEIIIGWKGKNKNKQKESKQTYFSPADVLQSYETKKAVLEIYTEKTVTKEGESLVAKLPKFVYNTEQEIEKKYVKKVLVSHEHS